jgi:hypothetical protein
MKLGNIVMLGLFAFLLMTTVIHFLGLFEGTMSNNNFYLLTGFSFSLMIFHFGGGFTVWLISRFSSRENNQFVYSIFDFLRCYLIYILIFAFQLKFILVRV